MARYKNQVIRHWKSRARHPSIDLDAKARERLRKASKNVYIAGIGTYHAIDLLREYNTRNAKEIGTSTDPDHFDCPLLNGNARFLLNTFIKTCAKRREIAKNRFSGITSFNKQGLDSILILNPNTPNYTRVDFELEICYYCKRWKEISDDISSIPNWLKPHIITS